MTGPTSIAVFRIATSGPGDASGLLALIDAGALAPADILAVFGKTEGNGGVNDFTREFAVSALCAALAPRLGLDAAAVEHRIAFVMSGGTEGVLSPHLTIFARAPSGAPVEGKRLSVGIAQTRDFLPEEIGRAAQITETAAAVKAAMAEAGIDDPADVHFVQVKCPLLTSARIGAARARGESVATLSTYTSMAYSRGASSLGIALALGEIAAMPADSDVLRDWSLYSRVASASSGVELMHNVVVVLGNAAGSSSPYVIGHAVMKDAIDLAAVAEAFASVGFDFPAIVAGEMAGRVVNVFAKAEASPDGTVRGDRHTMLEDTDISSTRHARAAVGGLVAGAAGTGAIYISGGAEHQGPPGGGPIAVIAKA
ncbi:ring-opening amidohydrolase [Acuticoccus kandeliae]|uniref:cyanuric acid amidohydrolase n=1 Tax=Acuticoccus kandeliae TaxID=2073160 RepID=UPI000D3E747A|nr:ring-opening amidohydrolase [Acuticoccus kandeliae]